MKTICIFLLAIACVYGKTFTKCSLTTNLIASGVDRSVVHHWVCMAQAESGYSTTARNVNHDGSADHGIFQINDYWNCDPQNGRHTKNGCGHACSAYEDTNLRDDVACIKTNLGWHHGSYAGFSYGYRAHCKGVTASFLSGCSY